jgi:hypothetical protein
MRQTEPIERPLSGEAGETLVGLLVIASIIAVVALSVTQTLLSAVDTTDSAQVLTEVTLRGIEHLESLRALPFEDDRLEAGGSLTQSEAGYSEDPLRGHDGHFMRWTIVDETPMLKRVTLVVGSRTHRAARSARFQTFVVAVQ